MKTINLIYDKIDHYNEIHCYVNVNLTLNEDGNIRENFMVSINNSDPELHVLNLTDAGTMGYAKMKGNLAVSGELSNISEGFWGGRYCKNKHLGRINVIGSLNNLSGKLLFWRPLHKEHQLYKQLKLKQNDRSKKL